MQHNVPTTLIVGVITENTPLCLSFYLRSLCSLYFQETFVDKDQ